MRLARTFAAVTVAASMLLLARPGYLTGLFTDDCLQFACGIALYSRLCRTGADERKRADVLAMVALGIIVAVALFRDEWPLRNDRIQMWTQLGICASFAVLLALLRPFDERLEKVALVRVLSRLGTFSYSLYLTHQAVFAVLLPQRKALESRLSAPVADVLFMGAAIGFGWVFFRLFERPFLNRPWVPAQAPAEAVAAAGS